MRQASPETAKVIQGNWLAVRQQVDEACAAAGRSSEVVRIIGVSKYVGVELTQQLFAAGCRDLGENRPQALWSKVEQWTGGEPLAGIAPRWHLIGHLQRNKVRRTLPAIHSLHSLDSVRLARVVSDEALAVGRRLPVMVEVNVTNDTSKTGLPAEQLEGGLVEMLPLAGLEVCGLMAMSSLGVSTDEARREFARVRQLRDSLQERLGGAVSLEELSMGMSGDFAEAIAEGATQVRIGTSLWRGILDE